jgi:hypothetical protein
MGVVEAYQRFASGVREVMSDMRIIATSGMECIHKLTGGAPEIPYDLRGMVLCEGSFAAIPLLREFWSLMLTAIIFCGWVTLRDHVSLQRSSGASDKCGKNPHITLFSRRSLW